MIPLCHQAQTALTRIHDQMKELTRLDPATKRLHYATLPKPNVLRRVASRIVQTIKQIV